MREILIDDEIGPKRKETPLCMESGWRSQSLEDEKDQLSFPRSRWFEEEYCVWTVAGGVWRIEDIYYNTTYKDARRKSQDCLVPSNDRRLYRVKAAWQWHVWGRREREREREQMESWFCSGKGRRKKRKVHPNFIISSLQVIHICHMEELFLTSWNEIEAQY